MTKYIHFFITECVNVSANIKCNKLLFQITCAKYAMKIIKKSRMTNGQINHLNDPEKIMNEINIMKAVRHVSYSTVYKTTLFFRMLCYSLFY